MGTPLSLVFDVLAVDRASAVFARVGTASEGVGTKVAKLATGFSLVGAAVGVISVKMAADFQTATNQLVTSAGETEANLGMIRTGLLKMAGEVGVPATELAKGMYQIESAGFHGAAGLNLMRAAAEGAKAEGANMETVANALTTVMNNYGSAVQNNAVKGTDFLVATVSLGKTRMEDFAASISNVLPVAKSAGIGLAEVGGAMATMTSQGISSDQAATYLRQTIVKLADQTPKAKNEMKALGLESIDVSGHLGERGLAGTLQVLTDAIAKHLGPQGLVMLDSLKNAGQNADKFQVALSNLPPAAQTYIGALTTMVGGQKTMMGALSLTGEHMKTFLDDTKQIAGQVDTAKDHVNGWEIVQKSFNQKLAEAKASVGAMAIEVGTKLLPVLSTLVSAFVDKGLPAVKRFAGALEDIGTAVVSHVKGPFDTVKQTVDLFFNGYKGYKATDLLPDGFVQRVMGLHDAFDKAKQIADLFFHGYRGYKATDLLPDSLVQRVMGFHDKLVTAWTDMKDLPARLGSSLTAAFGAVQPDVAPLVAKIKDALVQTGGDLISGITTAVQTGDLAPLGKAVGSALAKAVIGAGGAALVIGGAFVTLFAKIKWDELGLAIGKSAVPLVLGFAVGFLNNLGGVFPFIYHHFWETILAIIGIIPIGRIAGLLGHVLEAVPVLKMFAPLLGKIGDVGGLVEGAVGGIFRRVGGVIKDALDWALPGATGAVRGFFDTVVTTIYVRVTDFASAGKNLILGMLDGIRRGIVITLGDTLGGFFRMGQEFFSAIGRVGSFIAGKAADIMDAFHTAISGGLVSTLTFIAEIPLKIIQAMGNVDNTLVDAGTRLIAGLARGIKNSVTGALGDAMGSVTGFIKDHLPGSPVKRGPLVSWNNGAAGKRLMDLLAGGIRDGGFAPVDALSSVTRKLATSPVGVLPAGGTKRGHVAAASGAAPIVVNVQSAPREPAAESVPRALRRLQYIGVLP